MLRNIVFGQAVFFRPPFDVAAIFGGWLQTIINMRFLSDIGECRLCTSIGKRYLDVLLAIAAVQTLGGVQLGLSRFRSFKQYTDNSITIFTREMRVTLSRGVFAMLVKSQPVPR